MCHFFSSANYLNTMSPEMKQALRILGYFGCSVGISLFASRKYEPMEGYDEKFDAELIGLKNQLKTQNPDRFDLLYINRLRRCNIDTMYRWDLLNQIFRYNRGYVTHWYDGEKKMRCEALVRSDGKILSSIEEKHCEYLENTVLKAKVVDGYLVGIAENVLFSGKGNYPFYNFEN